MRANKTKRIVSVLVAAFMVVVLAGSAFAFGTGALTFNGTVNIDTALDVQIMSFVQPVGTDVTVAPDRKSVDFNLGDIDPGETLWVQFTLINEGTVPAKVSIVNELPEMFEDLIEVRLNRDLFGRPWYADHAVIVPVATNLYLPTVVLWLEVTFCEDALALLDVMYIDEVISFTVNLEYNWYRGPIN